MLSDDAHQPSEMIVNVKLTATQTAVIDGLSHAN